MDYWTNYLCLQIIKLYSMEMINPNVGTNFNQGASIGLGGRMRGHQSVWRDDGLCLLTSQMLESLDMVWENQMSSSREFT